MLWVPEHTRDNESPGKRALRRGAPLTFGVFGSKQEGGTSHTLLEGGSGVLTHPFSGLTAKHVGRYLMTLDSRGEHLPKKAFETQHAATLFQHLNPLSTGAPQHSFWNVTRVWDSPLTDISLVQVAAGKGTVNDPTGYYPWRLLPPPVGAKVYLLGFPGFELQDFPDDAEFGIQMTLNFQPATVSAVYPIRRGTGLLNYPCFEVDQKTDPGFSGGAVIYDEALCGIVSVGSDFEDKTWCASLWPLAFLEYDSELPGVMTTFSGLFESGGIRALDWDEAQSRISQREDDVGLKYAFIDDKR